MQQAALTFHCDMCNHDSSFPQEAIIVGRNIADITCPHCKEQWHITFDVFSLEPLTIGHWEMKREVGTVQNGVFIPKQHGASEVTTFKQKLAALGLTAEQVEAACQLIDADLIGEYELEGDHQSFETVDDLLERMDFVATRNGLRKEQRKKLQAANIINDQPTSPPARVSRPA